jgi:hypothetical protein
MLPMCEPVVVGLVLTAASIAVNYYGQEEKKKSDQKYYDYQAKESERQADQTLANADLQASLGMDTAAEQSAALESGIKKTQGAQTAAIAASGYDLGSKTAEDLALDSFTKAQKDKYMLQTGAQWQDWSTKEAAKQTATGLRKQAQGYRMGGAAAQSAAGWNQAGTILGGASQMENQWYRYKNEGR